MARLTDAEMDALLRQRGDLPEEGGFHSQDGLFFRRLDDGRVRVSVVRYSPTSREAVFSTVLTPEVWASIAAFVSYRDETSETWDEARRYHMGALAEVTD